ncbi:DMT family transporter [Antrihabitans cavernicola]|uniref:QacE family quaternary ammonium compound efflux SMR transporter n=1 Tax=Antrihabitans cavernicola TaxID=2495913 RepID=A0A5A7SBL9_9NOCA|nr:SMR family transporter [Spelaeibacter cavernicola]KAA0021621.1 QacE family quaternary ammonium compound efflux SMR transporter [Spelaeibacter cavernicola]
MGWIFLAVAVLSEVCGTLSLRVAASGRKAWYAWVAVGYVLAFVFLSLTLENGVGLGVAYGIWAAAGVALTSLASKFLFKESLTPVMMFGIVLVMAGVLLIETGSTH